jgi:peptide/nickel transport system permease protein
VIARFWRVRHVRIGLALVGALGLVAIAAPVLAPYRPDTVIDVIHARDLPPSLAHPLGTDPYSRDVLSRVLYGARVSLAIAAFSVAIAVTLGTAVGLTAGFAGGAADAVLMRLVDAGLAIPRFFVLLVVLALWNTVGPVALGALIGLTGWFGMSRIVRQETESVRHREYVTAARAVGCGTTRTLLRHVLPNVAGPVIVAAALGMGNVILLETGLSYLGIGVMPPTPSWGNIIWDGHDVMLNAPWISMAAGLAVVLTVLAFSYLGEGLRRALEPSAT